MSPTPARQLTVDGLTVPVETPIPDDQDVGSKLAVIKWCHKHSGSKPIVLN